MSIQFVVAATNIAVLVIVDHVAMVFTPGLRTTKCCPTVSLRNGTVHPAIVGEGDSIILFLVSFNLNCFYDSFHPSVKLNSRLISVSSDRKVLYVGGQLDNSAKVFINTLISNLVHVLYYISMFTHFLGRGK